MLMKCIRVCVLACSYDGSESELKKFEGDLVQTPQHYFGSGGCSKYSFHLELIKKATAYRQIRDLVSSGLYDVFYNQCDGAKDEDRAGAEVVQTLEEFRVPFTGAISRFYELSKIDMKFVAHINAICTARHTVLDSRDDAVTACAHMLFPMIIKHISGYSSVGMDKFCKVHNNDELITRSKRFIQEYRFALVEEFISGDEATILVCRDSSEPDGIRVFHPICVQFPDGEDFKHFDLKWVSHEDMQWRLMSEDDPALMTTINVARVSFNEMMGGVGYGRVDVRIDRRDNNRVVFLEINPNCGIMYPPGQEGSADWILKLSPTIKHCEFAALQISEAMMRCDRIRPLYATRFVPSKGFILCSSRAILAGETVIIGECAERRVCSSLYAQSHLEMSRCANYMLRAWPLGCSSEYYTLVNHDRDKYQHLRHSCSPNVGFSEKGSLDIIALRDIAIYDELTIDYSTFMTSIDNSFEYHCACEKCTATTQSKTLEENKLSALEV